MFMTSASKDAQVMNFPPWKPFNTALKPSNNSELWKFKKVMMYSDLFQIDFNKPPNGEVDVVYSLQLLR